MAESLAVKRYKLARGIRNQQVEQYMNKIRNSLLANEPQNLPNLTEEEFRIFRKDLAEQKYSPESTQAYLRKLLYFSDESLGHPGVFVEMTRALRSCRERKVLQRVTSIALQVVHRVVDASISVDGELPLEKCFLQVLRLLEQFPGLEREWPNVALIRSQVVFERALSSYSAFVSRLPQICEKDVATLLATYRNFTAKIGKKQCQVNLSSSYQFVTHIAIIIENFQLSTQDLRNTIHILNSLIESHSLKTILNWILETQILQTLFQLLSQCEKKEISHTNILALLDFFGGLLTGDCESLLVLKTLPKFIPTMRNLLNINLAQRQSIRNIDKTIAIGVFFCLANAMIGGSQMLPILTCELFRCAQALAQLHIPHLRTELAAFLLNSTVSASAEQLEIICDHGLIPAIGSLIQEQNDSECRQYALRALLSLLKSSKDFPRENCAWKFIFVSVKRECEQRGIMNYVEGLVASNDQKAAQVAEKILVLREETIFDSV